jgi:hypothetical protein
VYEGYDYPAGNISTNLAGGTGWAGAWIPDVEGPATNHVVSAAGLSYTDASGNVLMTTGGKAFYSATNLASGDIRSFRDFAAPRTNGTTWVSFMGRRLGPTTNNTGTPNNPYPRAANLSFYEGGSERFAIGNGSGAVSNLWSILPGGSVANAGENQRSAVPMDQLALVVLRIDHVGDPAAANDYIHMWINPPLGVTPSTNTAAARTLGTNNYSFNRIRPFVGATDAANSRPFAEMDYDEIRVGETFASVTPSRVDVTRPGDAIVLVSGTNDSDANSGPPPAGEAVANAINNVGQKYLNFLDFGSGFAVTPSSGMSVVSGIRLWTANDAPERDPASYKLEGSTSGPAGPFTTISEGPLALPTGRNPGGLTVPLTGSNFQVVNFANTTAYTTYRLTFPTLRDSAAANSMQIAEVELLGTLLQ